MALTNIICKCNHLSLKMTCNLLVMSLLKKCALEYQWSSKVTVWLLWPCTQELWKANGPIGTKYRIMYMELLWVHWQISIKPCKVLPCILWVATGLISKLLWQANTFSGSLFPRNVSIVKSVCYRSTMIRTATHSTPPLTAATFFRLWDSSVHPLHATISSMHSCTIPRC